MTRRDLLQARRAFRVLGAPLARQECGAGRQDWLRPETIDGLGLDLAGTWPRIIVHVARGWPLHVVPRWLDLPGGPIALVPRRMPRARLQCANVLLDAPQAPLVRGAAGFLATDAYAPEGRFLVTAGHVLAAASGAAFDSPITIEAAGPDIRIVRGRLAETSTPLGTAIPGGVKGPFPIDAGLVRLLPDDWRALSESLGGLVPRDVASSIEQGTPMSVLSPTGDLIDGIALQEESMVNVDAEVLLPNGMPTTVNLRIEHLRSVRLSRASQPGDSGAPVWNADEALIGIHCAYRDAPERDAGNALYTPVSAIEAYFDIVPLTRASRASPLPLKVRPALRSAAPRPPLAPPAPAPAQPLDAHADAVDALARTLWAEARGEGDRGMEAVACVVLNRVAARRWWGRTIKDVCCYPWQFSCWNEGTSSRTALLRVTEQDAAFRRALSIAREAAAGRLTDFTSGAEHYHAIGVLPSWARNRRPCFTLGRHIFYNDIERR